MFGLWWDGTLYSEMVHCSAMSGFFTFTSLRCSAFDEMSELSFSFDSALSRSGSPSDGASTLSLLSSPFDGGCLRSSFDSRWSCTAVHCFFPQVGGCSSFKSLSIQTLSPSSFFIENFLWYTFFWMVHFFSLEFLLGWWIKLDWTGRRLLLQDVTPPVFKLCHRVFTL